MEGKQNSSPLVLMQKVSSDSLPNGLQGLVSGNISSGPLSDNGTTQKLQTFHSTHLASNHHHYHNQHQHAQHKLQEKIASSMSRFDKVTDKPVKLLTYNIFMRPIVGDSTDLKNQRIPYIKGAIIDFDIVCFQELFSNFNNRRSSLLSFANKCHFKYASVPPSPSIFAGLVGGSVINSGLLTISKYPIVYTEFFAFSAKSGVDGLALKGVLYSKIRMPNHHHVHVFNTHTQATYNNTYQPENRGDHNNYLARLKQIQEMRQTIDKCLNSHSRLFKDGPAEFKDLVILAGDFNVNANGTPLPRENFAELPWVKKLKRETFREYEYLFGVLSKDGKDKLIDLTFEKYGKHPVTFADSDHTCDSDGKPKPKETRLTNPSEFMSRQCLDYIFQLIPCADIESRSLFDMRINECRVNEFFVKQLHFTQLSDHYGIECSFRILPLDGTQLTSGALDEINKMEEVKTVKSESKDGDGDEWEDLKDSAIKYPLVIDPNEELNVEGKLSKNSSTLTEIPKLQAKTTSMPVSSTSEHDHPESPHLRFAISALDQNNTETELANKESSQSTTIQTNSEQKSDSN